MNLDNELRSAIDGLLNEHPVVLFMKGNRQAPQCGFSAKVVSTLDMLVPDYVTIDVLQNQAVREGIKEYAQWPTIPQLYVQGELVGGSDIVLEMMDSGELPDVLGVARPDAESPAIEIEDPAAEIMQKAGQEEPGVAVHLKIDAGWRHSMNLAPAAGGEISTRAGDIEILLDPWSATRADGLKISLEETLTGTRFSFDNPNAPPPVGQMDVQALKAKLDDGDALYLFDVRSPEEIARGVIPESRSFNEEAAELAESLPKDTMLVFYCHKGGRSMATAEQYRQQGYSNLHNLSGGIDAWSVEIDPTITRY